MASYGEVVNVDMVWIGVAIGVLGAATGVLGAVVGGLRRSALASLAF